MRANPLQRQWVIAAVAAAAIASGGCVLAAAGAGAGGAVYFSGNGVESILTVPIEDARRATEQAFDAFHLSRSEFKAEDEGARLEFRGRTQDEETTVTAKLERESAESTRLEVTARKSLVTWDKEYARQIAERIVEITGGS